MAELPDFPFFTFHYTKSDTLLFKQTLTNDHPGLYKRQEGSLFNY